MDELHLTKKDFKLEWYSGSGAGGQHRNKHQNCCRITHIETGLTANGTSSRSRVTNQREAFQELARKVLLWHNTGRDRPEPSNEVIRNYHAPRNEVKDMASGLKQPYKKVVLDGDLSDMVEARKLNMSTEEEWD